MPSKRRRIAARRRLRHVADMPLGVRWWLEHGRPLGLEEAQALDLGEAAGGTVEVAQSTAD
jgi:hypothetical protein